MCLPHRIITILLSSGSCEVFTNKTEWRFFKLRFFPYKGHSAIGCSLPLIMGTQEISVFHKEMRKAEFFLYTYCYRRRVTIWAGNFRVFSTWFLIVFEIGGVENSPESAFIWLSMNRSVLIFPSENLIQIWLSLRKKSGRCDAWLSGTYKSANT